MLKTMKSMLEVTGAPEEVLLGPSSATNETRVTLCFGSLRVVTTLGDPARSIDPALLRNRVIKLSAHLDSQGQWVSQGAVFLLGEPARPQSGGDTHDDSLTARILDTASPAAAPSATPPVPGAPSLGSPVEQGRRPGLVRPANASPFAVLSAAPRSHRARPTAAPEAAPQGPTAVRPTSPGAPGFGLQRSSSSGPGPAPAPARSAQPGRPAYAASSSPSPNRKPFDPSASVDDLDEDIPF